MRRQKFWAGLLGALALAFVAVIFTGNGKLAELSLLDARNRTRIAELEKELEQAETPPGTEAPELTEPEMETAKAHAGELGARMAELQNAYAGLSSTEQRDAFTANVTAMDACLTKGAKASRVPWYAGEVPGNWVYVPGEGLSALWLCRRTDTGELLAYATGTYDTEEQAFAGIRYEMSVFASQSVASSGGDAESGIDVGQVTDLAGAIAGTDVPEERTLTDDESMDVKESQQMLKEKLTKEGAKDAD